MFLVSEATFIFLPGHLCLLQILFSLLRPVQSLPPCCGFGFVQLRERTWEPVSQVWEHEVHPLHFDQLPCTKLQEEEMINCMLYEGKSQRRTQPEKYKSYGEEKKIAWRRILFRTNFYTVQNFSREENILGSKSLPCKARLTSPLNLCMFYRAEAEVRQAQRKKTSRAEGDRKDQRRNQSLRFFINYWVSFTSSTALSAISALTKTSAS